MNNVVELYSDGSCLNNPGPGGVGYIIRYWEKPEGSENDILKEIEFSQGYSITTNNRMELMGVINGVRDIINKCNSNVITGCTQLNAMTDSKYTCDAINKRWIDKWQTTNWITSTGSSVKNRDLWEQMIAVIADLGKLGIAFNITHIAGHSGHEFNERCDKLANGAAKSNDRISDSEYEKSYNNRSKRY